MRIGSSGPKAKGRTARDLLDTMALGRPGKPWAGRETMMLLVACCAAGLVRLTTARVIPCKTPDLTTEQIAEEMHTVHR